MNETELQGLIAKFDSCSVAVVGDLMLDRYIWGRASRISQEAPVPVVRVDHETVAPGGAANVVRNLVTLGAKAVAFGIIGDDPHGVRLCDCLREVGADVSGIQKTSERHTTVKTRVLAGNQQVVRIDQENTACISDELGDELTAKLKESICNHSVQAVILQDYAKGGLTRKLVQEVADLGRRHGLVVAMDPHPSNPFKVKGLRLLTPNRTEAFALAGVYYQPGRLPLCEDKALLEVGNHLLQEWDVELLLITLGGDGMALFSVDAPPMHIPTRAREVFDVSGAGDTVTSAFVLALLAGGAPIAAAHIANHAAGIVVGKVGTASVANDELSGEVHSYYA